MTSDLAQNSVLKPVPSVEQTTAAFTTGDLNDLCDATEEAIKAGGGFGWIELPNRNLLERYWQGVLAMPSRMLFVARLDGVICGAAQLITYPTNKEAQAYNIRMSEFFIAPWARGQGLSRRLLDYIEKTAIKKGFSTITLDVRETQDAAIQLYESAGYQLIGKHPAFAVIDGKFCGGRYYYKVIQPLENIVSKPASKDDPAL